MKKKIVILATLVMFVYVMVACGQKTEENKVEDSKVQTETNNQVETKDNAEISDDKGEAAPDGTVAPTEAPEVTAEPVKEPDLALITIKGKEYDLSGDYREVVGSMVKDGNTVFNPGKQRIYNEQGKMDQWFFHIDPPYILASTWQSILLSESVAMGGLSSARGKLVSSGYQIDDMAGLEVVFGIGIASVNDVDENLESMGFLKSKASYGRELRSVQMTGVRYEAIFVNGKVLDFSEYHDDLEEFKKSEEKVGIIGDTFYNIASSGSILGGDIYKNKNIYDIEEILGNEISLDEELLFLFAFEDACKQLETGKIDSFSVVSFEIAEEEKKVKMFYQECSFEEWESGTTVIQQ